MEYVMEVIENLLMIVQGPEEEISNDFILMAYSDILRLLDGARKELKSGRLVSYQLKYVQKRMSECILKDLHICFIWWINTTWNGIMEVSSAVSIQPHATST